MQKVLESYGDLLGYRRYGPDDAQASAIQEGWSNTDGKIIAWLCADDQVMLEVEPMACALN